MNLYPDQDTFVGDIRTALRSHQSVLAHAATGFGKTIVAAYIAKSVAERGKRVIFAVHRRNLLTQSARTFHAWGIKFGYIAAGYPGSSAPVQLASIETLRRRLTKMRPADLLYIDECHLACSRTWSEVIDHFRDGGSKIIGNTATPARLDGRPLGQHFGVIVSGPSVRELIKNRRLSDYRIFAPATPDMAGVHSRNGDFVASEMEEVMDTRAIVGNAAEHYKTLMPGKRALCFCVSIKASEKAAEAFREHGIAAAHIDGETPDAERLRLITDFADGRLSVLCNVDLITTGFDLASQVGRDVAVEAGIILRPTQSLTLWLQICGRLLRYKLAPAIIADHAGNTLRHGAPDDDFEWTLEGREKQAPKEHEIALRCCPKCFAVYGTFLQTCPVCGTPAVTKPRMPTEVDGQLTELDVAALRLAKKREEGGARTLEDLVRLAKRRGYKPGWAGLRHALRTGMNKAAAVAAAYKLSRELTD